MIVWYLLYLIAYIILYASIIVFIYINISGLFKSLGNGVSVFILMIIFLYIIVNRIVFYDQCFDSSDAESSCFTPECTGDKPLYDFSAGKCVAEGDSEEPPKEPKEPTEPKEPKEPKEPAGGGGGGGGGGDVDGLVGPPGPPGPPGPAGEIISESIDSFLGTRYKSDDIYEGFALLNNNEDMDLRSNFKDVGNNSYKADKLMNVLEDYLRKYGR